MSGVCFCFHFHLLHHYLLPKHQYETRQNLLLYFLQWNYHKYHEIPQRLQLDIFLSSQSCDQSLTAPHHTQFHKSCVQLSEFDWSMSLVTKGEQCRAIKLSLGQGWMSKNNESDFRLAAFGCCSR